MPAGSPGNPGLSATLARDVGVFFHWASLLYTKLRGSGTPPGDADVKMGLMRFLFEPLGSTDQVVRKSNKQLMLELGLVKATILVTVLFTLLGSRQISLRC